jgi:hypothetical protein
VPSQIASPPLWVMSLKPTALACNSLFRKTPYVYGRLVFTVWTETSFPLVKNRHLSMRQCLKFEKILCGSPIGFTSLSPAK